MIPETPIIRMLLNSHNLNTIISGFRYTRQYFLTELIISAYPFFFLSHTDMTFINHQRISLCTEHLLSKPVRILRLPNLCAEYLCLIILYHTVSPCWYTFSFTAIPTDFQFIQIT